MTEESSDYLYSKITSFLSFSYLLFFYTYIHNNLIKYFYCFCGQIRANCGISVSADELTPPLPRYMPPCELLLPWVVQACCPSPPLCRMHGRKIAYQLLCEMTITHWHTPPPLSHLAHFYRLLHLALQSNSVSLLTQHISLSLPWLIYSPYIPVIFQ